MPTIWMISTIILWILVLVETALLLLLLRGLGQLKVKLSQLNRKAKSQDLAGLDIGEQAPDFAVQDETGTILRISDFPGKPCVIAFVSATCATCRTTIDILNRLVQEEPGIGVFVVGTEDPTMNRVFSSEYSARMPILTPIAVNPRDLYAVLEVPFLFFLDSNGTIRSKGVVHTYQHLRERLESADLLSPAEHWSNMYPVWHSEISDIISKN